MEIVAMATDLAEFLGAAVGFNLLLGIPLLPAALLTGVTTLIILALERRGIVAGGEGKCRVPQPRLRQRVDLPALSRLNDGWHGYLTLVTTIPAMDPAAAEANGLVRYVGPILDPAPDQDWQSPWAADDDRPMVLVSFTTTRLWDQGSRIRNTLTALAEEPVRVLVCVAEAADVAPVPANAVIRSFVPHRLALSSAAVTVTHAGHGTVAASLAHGVPLVALPNPAADQPFLAARLQQLGAGIALDGEAGPEAIRTAVRTVMAQPCYASAARGLGDAIHAAPGARGAATELEALAKVSGCF